MFYPGR
ncbi:hypothetical protein ECPA4_1013, partial [Escherichia coli PA4]